MCEISLVTKFNESHFAMVAAEPFFSGSALDWNMSRFSSFSVAGDINVNNYVYRTWMPSVPRIMW